MVVTDLFSYSPLDYPHAAAGAKKVGTSEQAAREITPTIKAAHKLILAAYKQHGDMTSDECAAVIERSVLFTRPRISEMLRLGLLRETCAVRFNASGKRAAVLGVGR